MTKNFSEDQYRFILNNCSTDQQRDSLIKIRDFCKKHFYREYSKTRRICFDTAKTSDVALIRLEPRMNPEVVIKLPHINKFNKISQDRSSRYGFDIEENGCLSNWVTLYQVNELTRRGKNSLSRITDVFLINKKLSNNLNNLVQLIEIVSNSY